MRSNAKCRAQKACARPAWLQSISAKNATGRSRIAPHLTICVQPNNNGVLRYANTHTLTAIK